MKFSPVINTKSMMTIIPIVLFIFISSFDSKNVFLKQTNTNLTSHFFLPVTHAASSCYTCNPCGTTWNSAAATVAQTSNPNDYCRVSLFIILIEIIVFIPIENSNRKSRCQRFYIIM